MDHKKIRLKEGVSLELITDKKFKTNTVSVSFLCGEGEYTASSSALLTGVLSRSCPDYPGLKQLNRALDELYDAQLTTDTVRRGLTHVPTFSTVSLADRFSLDGTDITGGALDVLYRILFSPLTGGAGFDRAVFESERDQLKEAIKAKKNSRSAYAVMRCTGELMRNEPEYAPRLGSAGYADTLTPDGLYGFYLKMLSTAPVRITAVLSDGAERVTEFAEKAALLLEPRADGTIKTAAGKKAPARKRRVEEKAKVRQDVFCLGCDLDCEPGDGLEAERALFNEILFQNNTSRLFENVREKLSLCYYISAASMADLKKLVIYAGIDGKNAKKTEAEILRQLDSLKNGAGEDELRRCKLSLKNDLLSLSDSPSRLLSWYLSRSVRGAEPEPVEDFIERVARLTADDTAHAASAAAADTVFVLKGDGADDD